MAVRKIKIEKEYLSEKSEKARWMVSRDSRQEIPRGQLIEWKLERDPRHHKNEVEAHFQFTHKDLLRNETGRRDLTRDLTAVIKRPGGKLKLHLQKDADRRKNPRYYAVWVKDPALPGGGVFAVGEDRNPPPEINVGGGG